jgi:TonB family protein
LIRLGVLDLGMKDVAQAIKDFEEAAKADRGQAAQAEMWMAIAEQAQDNPQAADALYQSALADAGPQSAMTATIQEMYSHLLQQEDKSEQASAMQANAASIRTALADEALQASGSTAPNVYQIGGSVKAPTVISKMEPQYSQEARIAKYQGTVLLSLEIGSDGLPRNIKPVRGGPFGLAEQAAQALSTWKFSPATTNGEPVAVAAKVEVNFRLF